MSLRHPIRDWKNARELKRRRAAQAAAVATGIQDYQHKLLHVSDEALALAMVRGENASKLLPTPKFSMKPYVPPEFLNVPDAHVLAMDSSVAPMNTALQNTGAYVGGGFPGFPFLAELTQITEYRDIGERTAQEMCRKWIEFRTVGGDKRDKEIEKINEVMKRLHVKEWFQWAATMDNFFGGCHLFLDFGDYDDDELDKPLLIDPAKIQKGSLKRIKGIEPITTYPAAYNADDPLDPNYYVPEQWLVYSRKVHASRLLTFISRPVPDLLKPVFNFYGISLSQLALPYVDYWLQARDSVGRLLKNFSTTVFKTDLTGILQGQNYEGFMRRLKFFTAVQNNQGVFLCDKETEELSKMETPLGGLNALLAQAQEHMASVAKCPLTILFGLSPQGLTATAETDITIYNNHVNAMQEAEFRRPLETLVKIIMCSELGEIYDDITFDFVDLVSMTEKEHSLIRTATGTTDVAYITAGVVTNEEVRAKLANDPDSGYNGLDVDHPEGKLQTPAPAGPPKGGGGGKSGGAAPSKQEDKDNATMTAAANAPGDSILRDAANLMLQDAKRMAHDAGLWPGNQHTGTLKSEDPTTEAMRHSVVAQRATNVANATGTRTAHQRAMKAHQRALEAHKTALVSASRQSRPMHEAYQDAHESALAYHGLESAPQPEEAEL